MFHGPKEEQPCVEVGPPWLNKVEYEYEYIQNLYQHFVCIGNCIVWQGKARHAHACLVYLKSLTLALAARYAEKGRYDCEMLVFD